MNNLKNQFPIFSYQPQLVYLDSAATSQKPKEVIEREKKFYEQENANIGRGLYPLAISATENYNQARQEIGQFIGAETSEVIFTKNTTESINLVAATWGKIYLKKGDEIVLTAMEHHSNLLPWQVLAKEKGVRLKFIQVNPKTYQLKLDNLKEIFKPKTKILAISSVSNVLGTINDLEKIIRIFRDIGKGIVIGDLAQSIAHLPVNLKKLDLDFAAFSGHKVYGPLGVGILYGRTKILDSLPPFMVGGGVVESVSQLSATLQGSPEKFEPGTPNIAGALSLATAIKFIQNLGFSQITSQEQKLTDYALKKLSQINEVQIYGSKSLEKRIGVIAFNLKGIHAHDVAENLATANIAIRAGHHCCMPLHTEVLKVPATCRLSLAVYNTKDDIDKLVEGLKKTIKLFN